MSPLHSISGSREFVEPADGDSDSPEAKVHAHPSTSVSSTPKSAENWSSKKVSPTFDSAQLTSQEVLW